MTPPEITRETAGPWPWTCVRADDHAAGRLLVLSRHDSAEAAVQAAEGMARATQARIIVCREEIAISAAPAAALPAPFAQGGLHTQIFASRRPDRSG